MLPVGSHPVLRFSIKEALEAGCSPIMVVRNPNDEALKQYLNETYEDQIKLTVQPSTRGVADALLHGYDELGDPGRCAVLLPDNVILNGTGIESLLKVDREGTVLGTIEVSRIEANYFGNSGDYSAELLDAKQHLERIVEIQEKRDGTFRCRYDSWPRRRTVPRSLLPAKFFERADKREPDPKSGEIDDVPILRAMIKSSSVYGYPIDGTVYDMGNHERYLRLNRAVLDQHSSPSSVN